MARPVLKCTAPPLVEVVYGVQFKPLPFTVATPGKFSARFADRYPFEEEAPPIPIVLEVPPTTAPQRQSSFAVPATSSRSRLLLLDREKARLLQIQESRFHHNWRKLEGVPYPRFEDLLPSFLGFWNEFKSHSKALLDHEPEALQYELAYTNHVEVGPLWDGQALPARVFPWLSSLKRPTTSDVEATLHYVLPDLRGRLHLSVRTGFRDADGARVVSFELVLRGTPKQPLSDADLEPWLVSAHEEICAGFVDTTGHEAHVAWGLSR